LDQKDQAKRVHFSDDPAVEKCKYWTQASKRDMEEKMHLKSILKGFLESSQGESQNGQIRMNLSISEETKRVSFLEEPQPGPRSESMGNNETKWERSIPLFEENQPVCVKPNPSIDAHRLWLNDMSEDNRGYSHTVEFLDDIDPVSRANFRDF
jgi:hypothetical protein